MLENPKCPSCGRPMALKRELEVVGEEPDTVFQCLGCQLVYMTKDHDPIYGQDGE